MRWQISGVIDRTNRTFWNAHRAINTFIGRDDQKMRPFAKTIHWADFNAGGVFANYAGISNDEWHAGVGELIWCAIFSYLVMLLELAALTLWTLARRAQGIILGKELDLRN